MSEALQLSIHPPQDWQGLSFQFLEIELTRPDRLIEPQDLQGLELPAQLDPSLGVILTGRSPLWLNAYLVHSCHATSWVACYDPRLGAVVAVSHNPKVQVGQVLPVSPYGEPPICQALMIVGPPDSGKSVISKALFQSLLEQDPNVFLQRAHWDGEGNWTLEIDPDQREEYKLRFKGGLTERFFPANREAILNLRRGKSLVLVDVGGMVQPEKKPILEACTHYLVVSSKPEAVREWHEFCRNGGNLTPVGVIHTTPKKMEVIHQETPYLEMTLGGWSAQGAPPLPSILISRVKKLLAPS